ncbi:MAG: hypothetical protein H6Q75_795 [Firmicutes bacterium]|nr:hypothetical protein [Bacillota bacterium]
MYYDGCKRPKCCVKKCVGEMKFKVYEQCCYVMVKVCPHCGHEYEHRRHTCCPRCGMPHEHHMMPEHHMMSDM